ncbi:MAG: DUF4339 domain-containing protein [Hyphomicrobiaceae bacterium]|nr:DUF4339 domain-containing protein [Hyphomicrobiaceae bacterium]
MSEADTYIEWYLARNGQQHGPLSDAELNKFRELGHLKPDDLVWRAGFPEWRTADDVFPEYQSGAATLLSAETEEPNDFSVDATPEMQYYLEKQTESLDGISKSRLGSQDYNQHLNSVEKSDEPVLQIQQNLESATAQYRRRTGIRSCQESSTQPINQEEFHNDCKYERSVKNQILIIIVITTLAIAILSSWYINSNQIPIIKIITDFIHKSYLHVHTTVNAPAGTTIKSVTVEIPTTETYEKNILGIEPRLTILSEKFWSDMRAHDGVWAGEQEQLLAKLRSNGRPELERLEFVVSALVSWRRRNADKILTTEPYYLRQIAQTFADNLRYLQNQDVKACYGFISQGELSPSVLTLYNNATHLTVLGAQIEAIIAAAENRGQNSESYSEPSEDDFKVMTKLLSNRGWTQGDVNLFSNPAALSVAPEATVCRLVSEWFEVQLQVSSTDRQMRLLAASLSPVIRG